MRFYKVQNKTNHSVYQLNNTTHISLFVIIIQLSGLTS